MSKTMRSYLLAACAAVAAVIVILTSVPAAGEALAWNLANVALLQARYATAPAAVYEWSGRAIDGYTGRAATPEEQQRLLQAYQMRWQAGSQVGETEAAMAAGLAGRKLAGEVATDGTCEPAGPGTVVLTDTTGTTIEAEDFAGVAADSLNIPTQIGDRGAVLLFTSVPISHSVCLPETGLYSIAVAAAHTAPAPVQVSVSWDGWPAGVLTYSKGDGSLGTEALRVASPMGVHQLALRFSNDFSDPAKGIDRNAIVESVRIAKEGPGDAQR